MNLYYELLQYPIFSMRQLDALVTEYPDVFKCIGETDIHKTYEMPKSVITYRKPRKLKKEQREAARERINIINKTLIGFDIVQINEYNICWRL